ncbi:MAG: molybdopterin-guanine dinucleotide biosynthesis protein MobA [Anaerolinea sp.]|nr:molybdopterin-guanine dinucleotide biosynthesis protein MobA [Anaerolinea sp.]
MTRFSLTGLILAGGKSSRFGSDKASALLRGRTLLQWALEALEPAVDAMVVVKAAGQQLPPVKSRLTVTVVEDEYKAMGPLAGLATGFRAVATEFCFATACDAPLLLPEVVRLLAAKAEDADVVVPDVDGFMQPLAAIYRPAACLPVFDERIARGALKIVPAFDGLRTIVVDEDELRTVDPGLRSFRNANRPERLAEIEALLEPGA